MKGLSWMHSWLTDLVRLKMGALKTDIRNVDLAEGLCGLAMQLESRKIFSLMDKVAMNLNMTSGSLNQQLMTEDVLLGWAELG